MLSKKHIHQFALFYLGCFMASYAWSVYQGLTFSQLQPVFFTNKLDVTGNLLMLTGIQHYLTHNQPFRIFFDIAYLLLPVVLAFACLKDKWYQPAIAISTALFNMIYNYYFSTMSFVSIEVLVAWMILPLIFIARSPVNFFYALHTVRILFIIFFLSAACWKIRAGGIFNIEQMSAIIISQHSYYMIYAGNVFSKLLTFLVNHKNISYALYLAAFLFEAIFIVGLFTLKFDRYLIIFFSLFVIVNYLLMEINYFSWLPFVGCLYFSVYSKKENPAQAR